MNLLILPAMGSVVSLLIFNKDSFGIIELMMVNMPLKTKKPNQTKTNESSTHCTFL